MQDLRVILLCGNVERAGARPEGADLLGIDGRKPVGGGNII